MNKNNIKSMLLAVAMVLMVVGLFVADSVFF